MFNVRLDPELHRRVAEMAMEEDLSLNAFVNKALKKKSVIIAQGLIAPFVARRR
ncbi:toxin-antitoxin system HicB family antitoxin [Escherichia coli]